MKATRGWILALAMLAACSDELTGPTGKLPEGAVPVITPTSNTACNKFWAGAVNGLWTDPTKWSPAGVPTAASSVCINAAGTYTVTMQPVSPATAITVDILALDVGGAGATPTLMLTGTSVVLNVTEGIEVRSGAVLQINTFTGSGGIINAAETITNSGTLHALATCGGCGANNAINADVINHGALTIQSPLLLGKVGGQYSNSGTITFVGSPTLLIPASAGNASFSQEAGLITGNSNFETFTIRAGTFTMSGGKARQRAAANLKPIIVIDGANLVLAATATDSATIGVLASSSGNATITGNVPALTTLWLGGPTDLLPGTITFNDAAQVNNGGIRLGSIDAGDGVLTIGGSGRLTNADSMYANTSGSTATYHFGIEVTNNATINITEKLSFNKPGGTYYNAGTIAGSGTVFIVGSTLVSTATGTVSPSNSNGAPDFTVDGGRLMGLGTVGNVTLLNGGTVEPGLSPGILTAVSLNAPLGTSLKTELGGTQVGTGYDQLNLVLSPSLGGSLDVSEVNGFLSGVCGQVFEVFSWNSTSTGFTTINGLNPAPTRALRVFTTSATNPRKHILYGFDPTVKLSVAPNPVAIAEGGPGVQYAVCLDGSPALTTGQTVVVTPTPNAQVTVAPPSVTFTSANWREPKFFTVTAVDDNVNEGNHTGIATHASTSGVAAYNGVAIASLTANITDNDAPPQAPTTTGVGSSVNPSTFGQSVTFTASVTSGAGTPAGTVQFTVDGNNVGSPVALDGNGQATVATATLGVGNHPVQATYSGNASFAGSNGGLTGGQTVNAASTSTAVSSNNNPSDVGESVTLTATVSSGGGTPAGTVQFNIDGNNIGGAVAVVGGQATFVTASLSAGTHPVTATFTGSVSFGNSNGALSGGQVVNLNATGTNVGSSQNPSAFGQSVTFTATVSSSAGTPSGSVQFSIDGNPVGVPVALVSGQATHVASALAAGNYPVSATYVGNTTHAGSAGSLGGGQNVSQAGTSTGVSSSANPSTSGQNVTFTATVTSGAGTPSGSIQFAIDGNNVGGAVPLDASGQVMFNTAALGVGNHPVQASFTGSTNYATSNGALSGGQTVDAPAAGSTTTTVQSSASPSTVGQSVTFTATVSSGAGTPTGTVQFNIDGSNIGGGVTLVGGQATVVTSALTAGTHSVMATYGGAASFTGSNGSLPGGQLVNLNATTSSVTSSLNPSTFGQSVTFTATVSSAAGTPSGTVQFSIDGSPAGGPVALISGQATHATSLLTAGNHLVSVSYTANATYASSSGSLAGGQNVSPAGTSTAVSSNNDPSTYGQSVTFTASVTSGAGTPTGSVQFNIDGNDVGPPVALSGSGQATFALATLGAGTHAIKATYGGASNYASTFGLLAGGQQVSQAGTTTGVISNVNPSTFGQLVTFTTTVTSGAGVPTGDVQFTVDGNNVGSAVALNGSGQATLNTSSLAVGNHTVQATYNGAANYASGGGSLPGGQNVNQAGSSTTVTSSVNPSTAGQSVTFTATVGSGAGTPTGTVQFSIDGSPVGGPVSLAAGQAILATSSLTAGNHTVSAAYGGSATFLTSNGALSGGQTVNPPGTGTGVGQPGIDIKEVLITSAFKSGLHQNTAIGSFKVLNSSSGPATVVTLGEVTVTFRSVKAAGAKTNHTATCTFTPVDPTNDVLNPLEEKLYDFNCTGITPSILSNATTLTAIVTVGNVSNQLGQVRIRTWSETSPAFKLP